LILVFQRLNVIQSIEVFRSWKLRSRSGHIRLGVTSVLPVSILQ